MHHLFTRFVTLFLCLASLPLAAQLTQGFNYQAVARGNGGGILANTAVNLRFTIKAGNPSGTTAYIESHAANTNAYGLVNVVLGGGNEESGTFTGVDWAAEPHYVIVELNGAKIDTVQFQAVPYAKVATDMKASDLSDVNGSPANGQVLQWDGTEWGPADAAASPWTATGNDIYYSTGNVGIGGNNPSTALQVAPGRDVLFGEDIPSSGAKLFYDASVGALTGGFTQTYNPEDSMGLRGLAWGSSTIAKGNYATALNFQTKAYGRSSFAAGTQTYADGLSAAAFGRFNVREGDPNSWVDTEPLFVIGNGSSNANRNNAFTIQKDGKIGFNEANPFYFLDMENDDISTRSIYIDHNATEASSPTQYGVYVDLDKTSPASTNTTYGVYVNQLNEGGTSYGLFATSNSDATGSQAAYGVRVLADNDGGTGVTYGVFSTVSASGSTSSGVAYAGYFSGSVFTTGSYLPSDARLKTNLTLATSALDKVLDLQIANYTYNHAAYPHMELPTGMRTGFVAQNVATLMPELVQQATHPATPEEEVEAGWPAGEDVHFQAVDYAGMTPYLVRAIQEQQALIEAQQAQLATQQAQIDALVSEVQQLKQK